MLERGLIHVYSGEGKGKTSAAVGLAVRAAGRGLHVLFIQFLKSWQTGEIFVLKQIPGITFLRDETCVQFANEMDSEERKRVTAIQKQLFRTALDHLQHESVDVLVLDEVMAAIENEFLTREEVESLLCNKPVWLELVLTGRNPPAWITDKVDYWTDMVERNHPFERGITARSGIEF